MDDRERAQRIAAMARLFVSFGVTDDERRKQYLRETESIDATLLDAAVGDVLYTWAETRLPPIGTIREAASKRALRDDQRKALPDPRLPRSGEISAGGSVGRLMSGMTSRVPGMTRIFARAREIRAAGLVPPDLWGRFASEVMAELELDPRAEVSEQMRRCMAHARQWREERGLSWDPEIERAFRAGAAS